jgi:hypothetical protein
MSLRSVWGSYWVRVFGGSALLVGALPFVLQRVHVTKDYGEGVLVGTGVAIIWYTVETFYLRRETALLRQASSRQIDIMSEQTEATIRPLLVARIETFADPWAPHLPRAGLVLRNIGHGPALFVEVQAFTVVVWTKGAWLVEVGRVDLVEPGKSGELVLRPHGQGQKPATSEIVSSLDEHTGHATAISEITIIYEDVQKRRFESLMQMGIDGTKLLRHSSL